MTIKQVISELSSKLVSSLPIYQVRIGVARLLATPESSAELETELLFGERVRVMRRAGNAWLRVRAELDGYEGFVLGSSLAEKLIDPTHRVRVPETFALDGLRVQTKRTMRLGMNSLVRVVDEQGKFVRLEGAGWVSRHHVIPLDEFEDDFIEVALQYVGRTYVWGGRVDPDCSALIQSALYRVGKQCPRNSSDQMRELGEPVNPNEGLRRRDLVFWKGHVGAMVDDRNIIHATDDTMQVVVEPLQDVIARRILEEPEDKKYIAVVRRITGFGQ